mmetsp:Transcript_125110/g.348134  ORF Transcript_125110/g.348134 Transcript_125110/m.348134 type:complete len:156 (-) Transcript_125110:44-511(-)
MRAGAWIALAAASAAWAAGAYAAAPAAEEEDEAEACAARALVQQSARSSLVARVREEEEGLEEVKDMAVAAAREATESAKEEGAQKPEDVGSIALVALRSLGAKLSKKKEAADLAAQLVAAQVEQMGPQPRQIWRAAAEVAVAVAAPQGEAAVAV